MRILVVCQYYYPENFQINDIAEQLAADGHEVTVLTGLPNYPLGVVPEEYKKGHRDEWIRGVHVIRCYEIGRKSGPLYLGLNYFSFLFSSLGKAGKLKGDFDLVFVYQLSPVLMGFPGRRYAKKHHVPMALYCCDLWPESLKMYIKNEKNFIFRYVKKLSKRVYDSCRLILCQSSSFVSYFEEVHRLSGERVRYLPAFADEGYLDADFTPEDRDTVDFVFLGNLGIAQNLGAVLSAVELIRDVPGFKVHFVGDGSCLEEMKQTVAEKGLESVVCFYGRRPVEEMPVFYQLADACLVSLKADNRTGWTLPSKVQGYLAAGKPVIGMIDGSAQEVIKEADCGLCVSAGDVEGLARGMRDFIEHPEKYRHCGENGREYFKKNFRKAIFMEKLEMIFEQIGRK